MRGDTKDVADFLHGPGSRFALAEMTDDWGGRKLYLADWQSNEGNASKATTCERQELDYLIALPPRLLWMHAGSPAIFNEKKMEM